MMHGQLLTNPATTKHLKQTHAKDEWTLKSIVNNKIPYFDIACASCSGRQHTMCRMSGYNLTCVTDS